MKNDPAHKFRFIHLDMIRGTAALVVCAGHLRHLDFVDYGVLKGTLSFWDKAFYFVTRQGHNAVMVFFVLSGFFVAGSVTKDYARGAWSWPRFAIRRLSRLWVVLVPALVLTLLWDSLSQYLTSSGLFGRHDPAAFLENLFFIDSIFADPYGTDSPLWSVAYEFWYYLMFPLLFGALALRDNARARVVSLLLFCICVLALPYKVLVGGLIWLMGYGAFVMLNHKMLAPFATNPIVFFVGLVGLILNEFLVSMPHGETLGDITLISLRDIYTGLSFSLMIPFLASHQPAGPWYRAISVGLSDISYTLYTVHYPFVVFLTCILIQHKDAMPSVAAYAHFMGYLALILLYALTVWWLFEARTGKVRKFLERRLLRAETVRVAHE